MAFTSEEKARVRYHLGYPNVGLVNTFTLGLPAAIEPAFMLEPAMDRVLPDAEALVRQHLTILDQIESQQVDDLELLAVDKVDEIDIREKEHEQLLGQYLKWQSSLSNIFGVMPNPYDKRFSGRGTGINIRVLH
jgi:hypothetical protein